MLEKESFGVHVVHVFHLPYFELIYCYVFVAQKYVTKFQKFNDTMTHNDFKY
jgi:hypothetical protein